MSYIDQLCSVLTSLGLNSKEIKIYKVLLEREFAIPNIVSKLTDIDRTTCYKYLDNLAKIGLVSETRLNNQKAFFPEDPRKVLELLEKKKENINLQNKIAKDAIKNLHLSKVKSPKQPKVQYFKGLEGIKKMYLETLKSKDDISIFFGWDFYPDDLRDFIDNEYIPLRVKNGIGCKVITNDSIIEDRDKLELRERRKINRKFSPNVEINLYDDKVNFVTCSDNEYMGILIENREIAHSLKEIFSVMWNNEDLN